MKTNPLDQAISWVSPGWAARRITARVRLAAARTAKAYYDGATVGRRGASIRRSMADPNAITARTLPRLRNGFRDLVRNNPHARRAVEAIVSNTIGVGIQPHFLRNGERALDIDRIARLHLHTKQCDANGRMTYFGLQSTALQAMVESGEVLVRRRWRRFEDGFAVPVQFQLLEGDYLDETRDAKLPNGGRIIQGVEFDRIGRRVAYWLFPEHPGSHWGTGVSERVRASEILHCYRADRPGQVRGIPWGASVMLRMADYADYEDAQLVRQKIAACYAVFVKDALEGLGPMGAQVNDQGQLIDSVEPGMVERLPPGTEVQFGSPPGVDGYGEYSSVSLHSIAAGWGVSYEALTGDLRGVNYSSGKMGHLQFEANIQRWQKLLFIPQFCAGLMEWWLEALDLSGVDVEDVEVRHIAPARQMIDPTRESKAERDQIRSGQKTWSQVIRERGRDPVEHMEEYRSDMELLDKHGIVLDSDARQRSAAGVEAEPGKARNGEEGAQAIVDELLDRVQDLEDGTPSRNGHPVGAHR